MNGRRSIVLFIACLSRLSSPLRLARRSSGLRSSAGLSDVVEAIDLGLRSYGEAFNISVISRQCTALCVLILSILPLSEYMWVTGSPELGGVTGHKTSHGSAKEISSVRACEVSLDRLSDGSAGEAKLVAARGMRSTMSSR